jgi:hypothetical protein
VKTHQDVKHGDEVRVFDVNARHQPEGWPGIVVKAGPKLVTVEHQRAFSKDKTQVFRRENGRANDGYGHQSYRTLDEVALRDRESAARDVLTRNGVTLKMRAGVPLEVIEGLAAVLAKYEEAKDHE